MQPTLDVAPLPGPGNFTPVAPGPTPAWSRPLVGDEAGLLACPAGTALVRKDTRLDVVAMWLVCERPDGVAHGPGVFYNATRLVHVSFDEGVLEGYAHFYHPTGSLATTGQYRLGKQSGEWSSPDRIGGRDGRDVMIVTTYADGSEAKEIEYRDRDPKAPQLRLDSRQERMVAIFRDEVRQRSPVANRTISSTSLVAPADVESARLKAIGWTAFAVIAAGLLVWKIVRRRRA